jgi:hypothetical protein
MGRPPRKIVACCYREGKIFLFAEISRMMHNGKKTVLQGTIVPTREEWLTENIILTTWQAPVSREDLDGCFKQISYWIKFRTEETHVLCDLREAGVVPNSAPLSAIRSKFLTRPNTGRVAVVGMDRGPQILAQVAVTVTKKAIRFFPDREEALAYLTEKDEVDTTPS